MGLELYTLFVNGKVYGRGNLEYMNELIQDYLLFIKFDKKVEFKIEKRS